MQRAGDGDVEAFGILYERYLDPIYRYIYFRISRIEEAEDLTESTFLKAWENLRKRQGEDKIENVRAWLYRIAHNLVVDFLRKKIPVSVNMERQLILQKDTHPSTEEAVQTRIAHQSIQDAVSALDEQSQDIIGLRFYEGLTHAEVGTVLGLNEGHVRVLQYRALKQLKKFLNEEYYD